MHLFAQAGILSPKGSFNACIGVKTQQLQAGSQQGQACAAMNCDKQMGKDQACCLFLQNSVLLTSLANKGKANREFRSGDRLPTTGIARVGPCSPVHLAFVCPSDRPLAILASHYFYGGKNNERDWGASSRVAVGQRFRLATF